MLNMGLVRLKTDFFGRFSKILEIDTCNRRKKGRMVSSDRNLNSAVNERCRIVLGCIKPTDSKMSMTLVQQLHLLNQWEF